MSNKSMSVIKRMPLAIVLLLPMSTFAGGSIGDVATNLMGPTSVVTKVVEIGCYVIGLAFVMMSIAQFKIHRQSPKLVPLSTPITLLILGVIALFIPYLTMQTETGSGKAEVKSESSSALPLPGAPSKGSGLPYPPGHNQQEAPPLPSSTDQGSSAAPAQPADTGTPSPDSGSSGGGWTTDPKYQH